MQFLEEVPLAPYTTFQIGGPARWFAEAVSEDDIAAGIAFAGERKLPLFILGGGSNLLVSDAGFSGLVLRIALRGITSAQESGRSILSAAAGEDWDGLVAYAVAAGLAGVECLSGIPGTVGGTPVQNVGAYGQEVSQTIVTVRAFDRKTRQFVDLPAPDCGFSYRRSIFNSSQRERYVVSRVDYALHRNAPANFVYADVARYFAARNVTAPTLAEVRDVVRSIRAQKGMLIMPGDADCRSAGSFFKNPVVPVSTLDSLALELKVEKQSIPAYPAQKGEVKLSAAWLIERAGFAKGYALGNAGISSRHTLALINRGGASASEVTALRDKVIAAVASRFAVCLEPEPVWLA
jgi:UDP-N-acetylmuramate dehydrogenase